MIRGAIMRFFRAFIVICFLLTVAVAQQTNQPKPQNTQRQPVAQSLEKPTDSTASKPEAVPEQKPEAHEGPSDKDKEEHFDMTEVPPVATHHQITVDGKLLKYTAIAGRLPIKRGDGKIEAEMFYVAYTLDGQEAAQRPLTFAFNGGPGSASVWLHMGAFGPKRVRTLDEPGPPL